MISIIIPTLNEESVIERTLRHLKADLNIPHEIIVTDGKSTDKTVGIARQFADKVVEHTGEHRQTIAEGRNIGAKAAVGDIIVFLDADCTIPNPNQTLTDAEAMFRNDPKLVTLIAWIRVGKEYETFADWLVYTLFNSYLYVVNNILNIGISGGEFQMMRKKDFENVGGFNEKLVAAEDVELLTRMKKLGRLRIDPHLIVYHTGRRAHKIGWPRLLSQWFLNSLFMATRGRAYHKEWKVIR